MLDDPPKPRLGALLANAQESWSLALRATLTPRGVDGPGAGADMLPHLSLEGGSQSLLAEQLGLSKQAVQQSLDHLEKQGLVRREPDPVDKRAKRVILTEAGLFALEARREAEREVEQLFRGALGKKGFTKLRKALKLLSAVRASTRE